MAAIHGCATCWWSVRGAVADILENFIASTTPATTDAYSGDLVRQSKS